MAIQKKAYQIWDKLMVETKEDGKRFWRSVTEKNSSAFHNSLCLKCCEQAEVSILPLLQISTFWKVIFRKNSYQQLQIVHTKQTQKNYKPIS